MIWKPVLRIRDPVPFWPLDPGSGIGVSGSRIPNPYFLEISDNFLGKKFNNPLKICPNFFLQHFKNKIILNFCDICGYNKRYDNKFFSPLSLDAVFGSGIRDPGWVKIRIRDKHPGSATLIVRSKSRIFVCIGIASCTFHIVFLVWSVAVLRIHDILVWIRIRIRILLF